ncbi:MAG: CoA-binding protein [Burkholderiales bacterium]
MSAHPNLLTDTAGIDALLAETKTIAVLGIKTEAQADQAAYYVPHYLQSAGLEVIPVPVYYPEVTTILGRRVYRRLVDIPGPVDLVNVFRRPQDVAAHVDDILAKQPKAVWLQLGIRNDAVAAKLATAGIRVVQDRCLMVDHRRYKSGQA